MPDNVFDSAGRVTLVDLPSDDLLERLHEGKVYTTDLGRKRAAENFFKRETCWRYAELAAVSLSGWTLTQTKMTASQSQ